MKEQNKPKKNHWTRSQYKDKDADNLLAKTNSQIGVLKNYNCRKLILNYANILNVKTKKVIFFNKENLNFIKKSANYHPI